MKIIKQLMSVELSSCSTAEIMATSEATYTSNENSMSHTGGNDRDEDFKAWEEDEQNFDKGNKILPTAYKLMLIGTDQSGLQ